MRLEDKIRDRSVRYGVVGAGYVGLPLAVAFARAGVHVTAFDVDDAKVAAIQAGRSYLPDVLDRDLAEVVAAGRLDATRDMARLAEMDVVSICVPTPLSKSRDPDISFVATVTHHVQRRLRPQQLVVLESTTYPGMTEEYLRPRLEERGLVSGRDFYLAFSPERVDPANQRFGITNTPKVVGGVEPESTRIASLFYRIAVDHVHEVGNATAAEMVKLLENTFRSVNIGLVNEVAIMCDHLGLDVGEIVAAAATKPFGFMRFDAGPGTGGHCIPLDPLYLSWKLRTLDYRARFVELASDLNHAMPAHVVSRVARALNETERSVKGTRALVLGVAYKPDVDDARESPSLEVIRGLAKAGAQVAYADPHVPRVSIDEQVYAAVPLDRAALEAADVVVVTTHHSTVDWGEVARHARLIVDTRGVVPRDEVRGVLYGLSGPPVRGRAAAPAHAPAATAVRA
jgi:UDP-N-acetyl-D-glucosamine dehydrogenase